MEKASKEDVRKELSALGSSLPSVGKGSPFRLPDGYFDQLPQMIQEKLATGRRGQVGWMPWLTPRRLQVGVVAMILLAVLSFSLLFLQNGTEKGVLFASGEEESELFFALYAGLDPFAMYDLVLETDITAEELYFGLEEPYHHQDEEAFMDYLYENVRAFELGAGDYIFPQIDTP